MKTRILSLFVCLALSLAAFASLVCGSFVVSVRAESEKELSFSREEMNTQLRDFIGENGERKDRTPFSEGEKKAAEYLKSVMDGIEGFETTLEDFSYSPYPSSPDKKFDSQNVVAVKRSAKKAAKSVVIGTNYDNTYGEFSLPSTGRYSSPQVLIEASKGDGAYMNGTGVAMLLNLAKRLSGEQLDYDLYVVFFGAGELWNCGADSFVEKNAADVAANAVLMLNFSRLAGDKIYAYSDEVKTAHGDYFAGKAEKSGVKIYSVPNTLPRMPAGYIDGIGYVHLGMVGASASFAARGVPFVNVFGGTFDTFSYGLDESADKKNIAYTENDTLNGLSESMPNYAETMASVATVAFSVLTDKNFLSGITHSETDAFDYSLFMKEWVASLIAVGFIVLCGLLLIPFAVYFEKKYPHIPSPPRKLKVAVFGMDYENPEQGDIYIDVKKRPVGDFDDENSPFDGY